MMANHSFKTIDKNIQELYVGDSSFGLSFILPDGYTMDDYNFYFKRGGKYNRCKDVVFIPGTPSEVEDIRVNSEAGITFTKGLKISVNKDLHLGENSNIKFLVQEKEASDIIPHFEFLTIEGNKDTTITFSKRLAPLKERAFEEFNDDGTYTYYKTIIEKNKKLDLVISDKLKSLYLSENLQSIKNNVKLVLTEPGYIYLNNTLLANSSTKKDDSSILTINSDIVSLSSCTLESEGVNSLMIKNNERSLLSVLETSNASISKLSFTDTKTEINANIVDFEEPEVDVVASLSFTGENKISVGNTLIVASPTKFNEAQLKTPATSLTITGEDNLFKEATIAFDHNPDSSDDRIRDFCAYNSKVDKVKGALEGRIEGVIGSNLNIEKGGKLFLYSEISSAHENSFSDLTIGENASLIIENPYDFTQRTTFNQTTTFKLNNVVVQNAKSSILLEKSIDISNSILKNAKVSIKEEDGEKAQEVVKISDSVLTNIVEINNISSISASEIDYCTINNIGDPAEIKNSWLVNKDIQNYSRFCINGVEEEEQAIPTENLELI